MKDSELEEALKKFVDLIKIKVTLKNLELPYKELHKSFYKALWNNDFGEASGFCFLLWLKKGEKDAANFFE